MTIPAVTGKFKWAKYSAPRDIRVGISDATNGYVTGTDLIESLDRFTGRRTNVVTIFIRLDDVAYQTKISNIAKAGYEPMITVEPWVDITTDQLIAFWNFIATIGTCHVRYAHEMNGNWYRWGNGDPTAYKVDWVRFFAPRTMNASRVWCVNNGDQGTHRAEDYYPGDSNVDLVGVDGYNRSGQTPAQVFDPMIDRVRKITNLPIGICEVGTPNGATKGQWITQLYDYVVLKLLAYVAWFNEDKELSWGIFGKSGGNTVFETHNAFLEHRAAIVKLDSRYSYV